MVVGYRAVNVISYSQTNKQNMVVGYVESCDEPCHQLVGVLVVPGFFIYFALLAVPDGGRLASVFSIRG
jgi:hypothetical protein